MNQGQQWSAASCLGVSKFVPEECVETGVAMRLGRLRPACRVGCKPYTAPTALSTKLRPSHSHMGASHSGVATKQGQKVSCKAEICTTLCNASQTTNLMSVCRACGPHGRKNWKKRSDETRVRSLLQRLQAEQATARQQRRYPAATCPICFEDLQQPGTVGAPPLHRVWGRGTTLYKVAACSILSHLL